MIKITARSRSIVFASVLMVFPGFLCAQALQPSQVSFGEQIIGEASGTKVFLFKNTTSETLRWMDVQAKGSRGAFSAWNVDCHFNVPMAPGETCSVAVRMAQPATGEMDATTLGDVSETLVASGVRLDQSPFESTAMLTGKFIAAGKNSTDLILLAYVLSISGKQVSLASTVLNRGQDAAKSIVTTFAVPVGTELVSTAGEGWQCDADDGLISCTFPSIDPFGEAGAILDLLLPTAASANVAVSVASVTPDPDPANNVAELSVDVQAANRLEVVPTTGTGALMVLLLACLTVACNRFVSARE